MTYQQFLEAAEAMVPQELSVAVQVTSWRHSHTPTQRKHEYSVSFVNDTTPCHLFNGSTPAEVLGKLHLAMTTQPSDPGSHLDPKSEIELPTEITSA